jgi:hypothetical protein
VPQTYSLDPPLGRWVFTQRNFFQNGRIDFARKAKLVELGFKFHARDKAKLEIVIPEAAGLSSNTWAL